MPSLHDTQSDRRVFVGFKDTLVGNTELPDVVETVPRKLSTEAERLGLVPSITKRGNEAKMIASWFFVLVRNLEKKTRHLCFVAAPKTYLFEQVSNPTSKVMPTMGNELGGFRTVGQRVFTLAVFCFPSGCCVAFAKRVAKTPTSSWSACVLDWEHSACTPSRSVPEVILSQEQQHSGWTASGHHDSVSQGSAVARHVVHIVGVCDVDPVGDIPSARYFPAMAVLPDGETAVMFGGRNSGNLGDAYTMVISGSTSTWAQLSHAGDTPSARGYHEMTAFPDGRIIMYGGYTKSNGYLDEIYTLDVSGSTATWTLLSNVGDVPPGRAAHAMAAFSDGTLVTFGGDVDGCFGSCDDMYTFTVTGIVATWSQKTTAGDVPSARFGHAMAVLADDTPVMFGGYSYGGVTNDVYTFTLSGSTATWTSLWSQGDVVPARYYHTLTALSDGSAVTFGGVGSSDNLKDLYELQISGTTATWTQLSSNPSARYYHTMVALGDGTCVAFGGRDGYGLLNDVDTLSLTVPTPLPTPFPTQSPSGSPTASPTLTVADASSDLSLQWRSGAWAKEFPKFLRRSEFVELGAPLRLRGDCNF